MATSRSFGEFAKRMALVAFGVKAGIERTVRTVAIVTDQTFVNATPFDTGRAKANTIVTIGSPSDEASRPPDPSGRAAITQGQQAAANFKLGGGAIFITNNLEYIVFLDEGSSAQAPEGMSAQAMQAGRRAASVSRVLRGI